MKIMICGGGTAGHVYPGLALAEALNKAKPDLEIVWVGCENGLERQVVPEAGYLLETLPVRGMPRKLSLKSLSFAANLSLSLMKAARLIKKHDPGVVIGMGGFAGFPAIIAAGRRGCPTVIHEQNAVPGLANRWLSKRADFVALAYDDDKGVLKQAKNVKIVGNPVREAVIKAKRQNAIKALGLNLRPLTILVFGGSRGARKINQATIGAYDYFRHAQNLQIVHITGETDYEDVKNQVDHTRRRNDTVVYHILPYIEEIGLAYAAADLAVTRAGASTVAELTARGLPSVLIPYPHATDNHQLVNAKKLEASGAAQIILDDNFNNQLFWQTISSLVHHPSRLKEMAESSANAGRPHAARDLAKIVLKIAGKDRAKMGKKSVS